MDQDLDAQAVVWNAIMGAVDSLALGCALNLDVFDVIRRHGKPMSLPELAAALPLPCPNLPILRRIMRYLTHLRLVAGSDDGDEPSYALTPASRYLSVAEPRSLARLARLLLDQDFLDPLHALHSCVDGDPAVSAFERVKGESVWARASRDQCYSAKFSQAMASSSTVTTPAMIAACPDVFEGVESLVDVGGGRGNAAVAIAEAFQHVRCIVFDLPHVLESLPECDSVEYVGGDMFVSIPQADAVLLMWILHDWSDDDCLRILKRCKEAINREGSPAGKLIIVDIVVDEGSTSELRHARLAFDLVMMAYSGGKERSEKEWRHLLERAGFSHCRIRPIKALQNVIEAHP